MSTLISNAVPVPAIRSVRPTTRDHQSNSWPILSKLLSWARRRRQRDALRSRIDDQRFLDDIGLRRDQAMREVAKAFWQ